MTSSPTPSMLLEASVALPKMPESHHNGIMGKMYFTADQFQAYAREAIAMDRAARAVPDEKQWAHVAVAEDGELRWMTGRKFQDCELYTPVNAPTALPAVIPQVADEGREPHPNCPNAFMCAGHCSGDRCADAMEPAATPPLMAAVPAQTVPWPTITAYAGGADSGGVAAWVKVQLGDGPETVEFVRKDLVPAVPAQTGEVARLADKLKTWIDLNVGRAAEAVILSEDVNRLAALAHSPKCLMCNGHGLVGYPTGHPNASNEDCPDCKGTGLAASPALVAEAVGWIRITHHETGPEYHFEPDAAIFVKLSVGTHKVVAP